MKSSKLGRIMYSAMFSIFIVPPLAFMGSYWWADRVVLSGNAGTFGMFFGASVGYFSVFFFISLAVNMVLILVRLRGLRPLELPRRIATAEGVLFLLSWAWLLDILITASTVPFEQTVLGLGIAGTSVVIFVFALTTGSTKPMAAAE
jgi:hypothetical protein